VRVEQKKGYNGVENETKRGLREAKTGYKATRFGRERERERERKYTETRQDTEKDTKRGSSSSNIAVVLKREKMKSSAMTLRELVVGCV